MLGAVVRRAAVPQIQEQIVAVEVLVGDVLDHAAQVPTVLSARDLEGASDSVHRQTLGFSVAPQRQARTVQTVQVSGISQSSSWMRLLTRPSL